MCVGCAVGVGAVDIAVLVVVAAVAAFATGLGVPRVRVEGADALTSEGVKVQLTNK